jgi:hypothetical protein
MTSAGVVKLSDFGVAKILPDVEDCRSTSGTHGYMVRTVRKYCARRTRGLGHQQHRCTYTPFCIPRTWLAVSHYHFITLFLFRRRKCTWAATSTALPPSGSPRASRCTSCSPAGAPSRPRACRPSATAAAGPAVPTPSDTRRTRSAPACRPRGLWRTRCGPSSSSDRAPRGCPQTARTSCAPCSSQM